MVKTRTTKTPRAAVSRPEDDATASSRTLPPSTINPPTVCILPLNRSSDARVVNLPHPATACENLYFTDPRLGIYEFTRLSAPKATPTSWLLSPTQEASNTSARSGTGVTEPCQGIEKGYITEHASILVATPLDPLFFLLPSLLSSIVSGGQALYVTLDDHVDNVQETSSQLADALTAGTGLSSLEGCMRGICDVVDAGDDSMFRVNIDKVTSQLLEKANAVVAEGLPASMETKLVQEALQEPTTMVAEAMDMPPLESEDSGMSQSESVTYHPDDAGQSSLSTSSAAQSSSSSFESSSSMSTAATSIPGTPSAVAEDKEDVSHLLRVRTAFDFILDSYVLPKYHSLIRDALAKSAALIDFAPLDKRLEELAALKKEAYALRTLSENISRKRIGGDDEEVEAARAEKRRKVEEEEAKKKRESRALKQLSKVNTSGMQKMSSFFAKAAPKKTATK